MKLYVVTMRRWGDNEMHSYPIGIFSTEEKARLAGMDHYVYRGSKYEPDIKAFVVDDYKIETDDETYYEVARLTREWNWEASK